MALAEDIQRLRDRVLADLGTPHDYYTDTRIAWRLSRVRSRRVSPPGPARAGNGGSRSTVCIRGHRLIRRREANHESDESHESCGEE